MLYNKFYVSSCSFFILSLIFSKLFYYPIGALTRIGNLSEKDYGENKKQDNVNILQKNGNKFSKIYVLGDSFSKKNIWQSHYIKKQEIRLFFSFHFSDVGCIDNWINWIIENKSKHTSIVIIQVIEQTFFYHCLKT